MVEVDDKLKELEGGGSSCKVEMWHTTNFANFKLVQCWCWKGASSMVGGALESGDNMLSRGKEWLCLEELEQERLLMRTRCMYILDSYWF